MLFYSESQGGCPCHILRLIIGSRYRKFIYASLLTMSIGVGVIIDICSIASGSFTDGDGAVILSEKQRDRAHGSGVQDAPPVDAVEQLRKLGELRDSGILSDEEFAAKKSVLLGKIK